MRYKKKPKPSTELIRILYDDRERNPWLFLRDRWPMERKRLKVGDYTIEGYEKIIAIEKKSGLQELLTDLAQPSRARFIRFLERLAERPVRLIVMDGRPPTLVNIEMTLAVMKKKSRGKCQLTVETWHYWFGRIMCYYQIPMIFVVASRKLILPILIEQCHQKAQELK